MPSSFKQRLFKEIKQIFNPAWTIEEVGRHWDETTDYDDINERTYSYFRRFVDAQNLFDLPNEQCILDICSRTGNGSIYYWQKKKVKKVVCADVTKKMQEICQASLAKYPIDFETKCFNSYPLPFTDNQFETILSFETIEHLPQPDFFLRELYRILNPGGYLILTTPNILWEPVHWLAAIFNIHHSEGPHRFIRHRKIKKWLKQFDFTIIKYKTFVLIPGGPKFLIKLGEWLERILPDYMLNFFALRRIYICQKNRI